MHTRSSRRSRRLRKKRKKRWPRPHPPQWAAWKAVGGSLMSCNRMLAWSVAKHFTKTAHNGSTQTLSNRRQRTGNEFSLRVRSISNCSARIRMPRSGWHWGEMCSSPCEIRSMRWSSRASSSREALEVFTVLILRQRGYDAVELGPVDPALVVGNLLNAGDHKALAVLNRGNVVGGFHKAGLGAGIQQGHAAAKDFDAQVSAFEIDAVYVGDLQFAPSARL